MTKEYKYEYLLHCWGGFWNEENIKIHHEPNFSYKWFNTKEERDSEISRLTDLKDKHGEYLTSRGFFNDSCIVMYCTQGYLTRFEFILDSLVVVDNEIKRIERNLGYGFFSIEEFDELGNMADYMKEWKYETNNLPDDHIRLYTTLILR